VVTESAGSSQQDRVTDSAATEPVPLPELAAGVYQHYKGPLYLVLGYGHDSNYEGRSVVVYVGLQLDGAHTGARLAVRTVEDFHALVCRNPHCDRYGTGGERPDSGYCSLCTRPHSARFEYVGPSWEGKPGV
jgi:hypothetical protein